MVIDTIPFPQDNGIHPIFRRFTGQVAPLDMYLCTFGSMGDIYCPERGKAGGRGQDERLPSSSSQGLKYAYSAGLE